MRPTKEEWKDIIEDAWAWYEHEKRMAPFRVRGDLSGTIPPRIFEKYWGFDKEATNRK